MSITTAQSGVQAAQTAFSVEVENVVSGQNTGGKAASVDFSAAVTSAPSGGYSPGAVNTAVSRNVSAQGIIKSTGIATHIAVTGVNGFVITKDSTEANMGQFGLKRGGAFNRNNDGFLEDKGTYLMGWPVNANGEIQAGINKEVLDDLVPIQVNQVAGVVRATSQIEFGGNLSSGEGTPVGGTFTKTQRIYDSMGTAHNLKFEFTRLDPAAYTTSDDNKVAYSLQITVDGGEVRRQGDAATIDGGGQPMIVTFNDKGQLNLFDYNQATESATSPKLDITWTDASISAADLEIDLNLGTGKGAGALVNAATIIANPNAEGNMTAYDGPSLSTYQKQDGLGYGRFENIRIEDDGTVSALFSNGRSVSIAKLAMGTVPSPNDLEFATGNTYFETRRSGSIVLGEAGENGIGAIKSASLESSTVSLDKSFSRIMELKIYHQGCLMTMKQADRMSEELIQIMK